MTYRGKIHNGAVVLDTPIPLPEGCEVKCEVKALSEAGTTKAAQGGFYDDLMEFAGIIKGGPPDASRNHDHYLYGYPKK